MACTTRPCFTLVAVTLLLPLLPLTACAATNGGQDSRPPMAGSGGTPTGPSGQAPRECASGLFADAPGIELDAAREPFVIRRRAVRIDDSTLDASPGRLTLNLFPDVCLVAVRDAAAAAPDVWSGTIEGMAGSSITLVTKSGVVMGSIVSPPLAFQIRFHSDGVHVVTQVDPSKFPKEKDPIR